ncbi:MAG TPA: alpha/beta hydrolase domain-containing protein [Caulobacterales bacterium]|jgi:hypothetical protein|nr:alpha/beta hydrolase domain-containing protein [Caulobacterales bacterium]
MNPSRRTLLSAGAGAAIAALWPRALAAEGDYRGPELYGPVPDPVTKGVLVWDPSAQGYVAEEYFLSGLADITETVNMADAADMSTRDNTADLARRKFPLTLVAAQIPYVTRVILYRPAQPTAFSGRVIVEPIHPVGGGTTPVWSSLNAAFMANGDALAAVQHPVTFAGLMAVNFERYKPLQAAHPSLLWGMLADAGRLAKLQILAPTLNVRRVYMAGYSFTGVACATFANYHHERTTLAPYKPVFDGYLPMANAAYVRPLDVPVIRLNTQSDFAEFGGIANRGRDYDLKSGRYRLYEAAGAAHVVAATPAAHAAKPPVGPAPPPAPHQPHFDVAACYAGFPEGAAQNDFPLRVAQAGAFANLYAWAEEGRRPPRAPLLQTDKAGALKLDEDGNVLGGLRFPQVSAPVATYGVGQDECHLFGYTKPFSAAALAARYGSPDAYVALVEKQVAQLTKQRFVTAAGADELLARARAVQF